MGFVLSFGSIAIYNEWYKSVPYIIQFKIHGYTKENALAVCSGKNLEWTAYCLNSFVRGIYFYNKSNVGKELSFDELVNEGGVCKHYADLYLELFKKLNFKTQRISIDISREGDVQYWHAFLLAYDKSGWCSLDQKHMDCFMYEE